MSWSHESLRIGAIIWKDFTSERRTKANFNAVVFMAVAWRNTGAPLTGGGGVRSPSTSVPDTRPSRSSTT